MAYTRGSGALARDPVFHGRAQNSIDSRLVALTLGLEPVEHVGVEADRELLLRGRPRRLGLGEELFAQSRDVGIVDGRCCHPAGFRLG